ncbi:hypothetical protein Sjap_014763 [Stephania japonica]|uniref:mitogen-activated protein kinase kinase n=1 Tax=Stephania japonica TaxID=461633 RepID=A0AAP0IJD9_9MAGN
MHQRVENSEEISNLTSDRRETLPPTQLRSPPPPLLCFLGEQEKKREKREKKMRWSGETNGNGPWLSPRACRLPHFTLQPLDGSGSTPGERTRGTFSCPLFRSGGGATSDTLPPEAGQRATALWLAVVEAVVRRRRDGKNYPFHLPSRSYGMGEEEPPNGAPSSQEAPPPSCEEGAPLRRQRGRRPYLMVPLWHHHHLGHSKQGRVKCRGLDIKLRVLYSKGGSIYGVLLNVGLMLGETIKSHKCSPPRRRLLRPAPPLPPPPPPPSILPAVSGQEIYRLGDLEKLQVLGHGSGGTVYKVRHRRSSAVYALKLIHSDPDPTLRRQVVREMDILRRTDSPHVIKCHAILSQPSGDTAFVLEYMDAGTLASVPISSESTLSHITRQVLHGLNYLHSHKIVHRDIKPSNLLVNANLVVKISDFGVSRVMCRTLDPCDSYVGTCAYMSPERFDPERYGGSYDGYAGDVWGLGLTLVELWVGRFPYLVEGERPDWASLMCKICFGEPPSLPEGASQDFRDFVGCCLQKDSKKRWTVEQLLGHPFVSRDRR